MDLKVGGPEVGYDDMTPADKAVLDAETNKLEDYILALRRGVAVPL